MKKILIICLQLLLSMSSYSQTEQNTNNFVLQSNGTFLSEDGNNYIVIDCQGTSQETLYNDFLVAITKLYVSPKTVIDKVENRIIKIKGYEEPAFSVNTGVKSLGHEVVTAYAIEYELVFQFKEGKVRVDSPEIISISKMLLGKALSSNEFSIWVKHISKLFEKEEAKLTGKQKKDDEILEKVNRRNEGKQRTIIALNNFVNGLIGQITEKSLKSGEEAEW